MILYINGNRPCKKKKRLNSSVNWDNILINNLKVFVGVLFGSIA